MEHSFLRLLHFRSTKKLADVHFQILSFQWYHHLQLNYIRFSIVLMPHALSLFQIALISLAGRNKKKRRFHRCIRWWMALLKTDNLSRAPVLKKKNFRTNSKKKRCSSVKQINEINCVRERGSWETFDTVRRQLR